MAGAINTNDYNATVTSSGNTDPLDTCGMGQLSFTASISSVTGSGAYFQVELQASDDAINWNVVHDTKRMTSADVQRISGIRVSSKWYRYVWLVGGTSPSATLNITTSIKDYSPVRTGSLFRYDDMDLKNGAAISTVYSAFSNSDVGCMIVRGNDTSSVATLKVQGSNDSINWHDHTGDFTISPNQTINKEFSGNSHRFMQIVVVSAATGGGATALLTLLWNSTGG